MSNRELLQLAKNFDPIKHSVAGWFVSEKLDGMRAWWDGGWTRGILCSKLVYSNTAKDARLLEPPVATGLWSRYAKPIYAPNWFLDLLPEYPLDGELYMGRGNFQELISTVKQRTPDERWKNVRYMVFDIPGDRAMYSGGKINNPNCQLDLPDVYDTIKKIRDTPVAPFYHIYDILHKIIENGPNLMVHEQSRLPSITEVAIFELNFQLDAVTDLGGEGLIVRKPEGIWVPKRVDKVLKLKKLHDSEARVLGYTWGKGKLEGLMGAAIVQWRDKTFELSGFTDAERKLEWDHITGELFEPGSIVPTYIFNPFFPRRSTITFRYTELSKDGIPLKARYYRMS